jgi:nitric oxide reductase NorD protein
MAAPTWPPTPLDAMAATVEEYGELARRVIGGAETDEDAELALLSHFLFAAPQVQLNDLSGSGTPLVAVQEHLLLWLRMVSGLKPRLSIAIPAGTDGADLYLPSAVAGPVEPELDAAIYRSMALMQLGLVRFGLLKQRAVLVELHTDWVLRSCWSLLAARYVMRRWAGLWPGTAADFVQVASSAKATQLRVGHQAVPSVGLPAAFVPLYRGLAPLLGQDRPADPVAEEATAAVDQIELDAAAPLVLIGAAQRVREHLGRLRLGPPPLPEWIGLLRPAWMLDDLPAELAASSEWRQGNKPLRPLLAAMARRGAGAQLAAKLKRRLGSSSAEAAPEWTEDLRPPRTASDEGDTYEEWDSGISAYRADAVRVLTTEAPTGPIEAYTRITAARSGEIIAVRREFAALRVEERWRSAQPDGSDLDLNRLISAMADIQAGQTPKTDWYRRFERRPHSVAILTLADLSGSTQGAVIHAEREALVLFSEGLRALDLPHAFMGFSSKGPRHCTLQTIKDWDQPTDDQVCKRIANLRPGGGTRLGAFIRHAAALLGARPEARRVLILLSDGRPEDGEAYRGRAGVEDSALAVRTARRAGVHTFCISMDEREGAQDYLRQIFGAGHFLICKRPEALPVRLPEVFRSMLR